MECCHVVLNDHAKREADVRSYIDDPTDENKFVIAKSALNRGMWLRNSYFDLLISAYEVSEHSFFKKKLKGFIEKTYYCNGCPPWNSAIKKFYLTSKYTGHKLDNYIHYYLAKGVAPSDALRSFSEAFWLSDQGTSMDYIHLRVLYKILGEEPFNECFSEKRKNSYNFELSSFISLIECKIKSNRPIFNVE